jgi:hypothetical protein
MEGPDSGADLLSGGMKLHACFLLATGTGYWHWLLSTPLPIHCVRTSGKAARNARNTQGIQARRKEYARNPSTTQGIRKESMQHARNPCNHARNTQRIHAITQGIRKESKQSRKEYARNARVTQPFSPLLLEL